VQRRLEEREREREEQAVRQSRVEKGGSARECVRVK